MPFHFTNIRYLSSSLSYGIRRRCTSFSQMVDREPHHIPIDVRQPLSATYSKERLKKWLSKKFSLQILCVLLLSSIIIFLIFNEEANNSIRTGSANWHYGFHTSSWKLSSRNSGYALKPEDLVDNGYFNSTFRVPTKAYRDYTHLSEIRIPPCKNWWTWYMQLANRLPCSSVRAGSEQSLTAHIFRISA